jgi:hypothetical protein
MADEKTPTSAAPAKSASKDDVAKDAAASRAAKAAPRKSASDPKPEDTTGAGTPLMTDEERARLDDRLRMADDGNRIEQRPLTHPGLKSAQRVTDADYSVEEEIRTQWPAAFDEDDD